MNIHLQNMNEEDLVQLDLLIRKEATIALDYEDLSNSSIYSIFRELIEELDSKNKIIDRYMH